MEKPITRGRVSIPQKKTKGFFTPFCFINIFPLFFWGWWKKTGLIDEKGAALNAAHCSMKPYASLVRCMTRQEVHVKELEKLRQINSLKTICGMAQRIGTHLMEGARTLANLNLNITLRALAYNIKLENIYKNKTVKKKRSDIDISFMVMHPSFFFFLNSKTLSAFSAR